MAGLGSWLLFRQQSGKGRLDKRAPETGLASAHVTSWRRTFVIAGLAALNKVPTGALLIPLATVLSRSRYHEQFWFAFVNFAAVPSMLIMVWYWPQRIATRRRDDGLMPGAWVTFLGSLLLLPTQLIGPGDLWITAQFAGTLGIITGATYEAASYSLIQDLTGGRQALCNVGIAAGSSLGGTLGVWVVDNEGLLPVVVALPASILSLVITRWFIHRHHLTGRKSEVQISTA